MEKPGPFELEQELDAGKPFYLGSLLFMGKIVIASSTPINPDPFPPTPSQFIDPLTKPTHPFFDHLLPPSIDPAPSSTEMRAQPPPLQDNERLYQISVPDGVNSPYKLSRREHDGLEVSLEQILFHKMFKRLQGLDRLVRMEHYVETRIRVPEDDIRKYANIRIEFYLEKEVFHQNFNQEIEKQKRRIEQEEIHKKDRKKRGGAGVTKQLEQSSLQLSKLKSNLINSVASRHLIMLLLKILGIQVLQPALIKPDISSNEISLSIISKGLIGKQTRSNTAKVMKIFDQYCASERSRLFGILVRNKKELEYLIESGGSFERVVCVPYLKKFLSPKQRLDTQKFEALVLRVEKSRYPVLGDFILDYLSEDNLSSDLRSLETRTDQRQSFFNLLGQLRRQFKQEDRKLDKRLKLNKQDVIDMKNGYPVERRAFDEPQGTFTQPRKNRKKKKMQPQQNLLEEGNVNLSELYGIENQGNFDRLAQFRRNMIKLLIRRNSSRLFKEFEEQTTNIREHSQPDRILTPMMPHQQRALTWMKFREHRISAQFLMREDYNKTSAETQRLLGVYWQELRLPNGTLIYTNKMTGCFSLKRLLWKQVSGGILALDMGLGKTVSAFALMMEADLWKKNSRSPLQARNLFITIPGMVPTEIEYLIKKHIGEVNYYIYDRNTRKLSIDLGRFELVVTSYRTVVSDFSSLSERERTRLWEMTQKSLAEQEETKEQDYFDIAEPELDRYRPARDEGKEPFFRRESSVSNLFSYEWDRIIIDEAHHIRNRKTRVSEAITNLQGEYRWCLTGSPILNDKNELFALCKFLRVNLFSDWDWWNQYLNNKSHTMQEGFGILHKIVRPILHQLSKKSEDRFGRSIISLPTRNNQLVYLDFDAKERKAYIALESQVRNFIELALQNSEKSSDEDRETIRPFTLLLWLRQFCVSPCLINMPQDTPVQDYFKKPLDLILKENEFALCIVCLQEEDDLEEMQCGHMICEECIENSDMVDVSLYECENCKKRKVVQVGHVEQSQLEMIRDNIDGYTSSKVRKVVEVVSHILERKQKCLVFTMWIKSMEQIALRINELGGKAVALHSKVKKDARLRVMEEFKEKDLQVLVTSLRMCGQGINLVQANNVIIVEPEWNPAIEQQGIDRVYRIGQTRTVNVYRLIVNNSIEVKLRELHEKKAHEAHYALLNKDFFKKKKYFKTLVALLLGVGEEEKKP